ncbi:4-hydroxybutyrate coenzyme A transferase [Candidatus Magnetoovum chiemensis]|nr:4-hydroxybutyrate coenzyme A transferase [Candidatus Magnetoovum chiemensis]
MNTICKEIADLKEKYPKKFVSPAAAFSHIHRGDEKFKDNFRLNSFFVGKNARTAVNTGLADYTPVFLSNVPALFYRKFVPINAALIQTSCPDKHGYMSLGISVDIVKAAAESAPLVIAQANSYMPRVHGDSFIHINDVDFIIPYDEPLITYEFDVNYEIFSRIGRYAASLVQDGDTVQVGYGSIPNAILASLTKKNHIGVHTELLSDGIVDLIKLGVIDNSRKTINRGKTVASFCMGSSDTYDFINNNPSIEFRTIDYTNSPLIIAEHDNMTAINSALEIDLTGQASAESIGRTFFSGIGGQADFMRGAVLGKNGKTILTLQSTAENATVSRIVPFIREGAGVTINRGDIRYIVTEYGIAYLHGKNIRERAMQLISIAHPNFRQWLIDEAKRFNLIYKDQQFIPGVKGHYPEELEALKYTKFGLNLLLRPVKISDEPLLKDFFLGLSDETIYRRFMASASYLSHDKLQTFAVIDYSKEMIILAVYKQNDGNEIIVGIGQYSINETLHTADAAFAVRDDFQAKGIGSVLVEYLAFLAKKQGLLGFTADVFVNNYAMIALFERMDVNITKINEDGVYCMKMIFK